MVLRILLLVSFVLVQACSSQGFKSSSLSKNIVDMTDELTDTIGEWTAESEVQQVTVNELMTNGESYRQNLVKVKGYTVVDNSQSKNVTFKVFNDSAASQAQEAKFIEAELSTELQKIMARRLKKMSGKYFEFEGVYENTSEQTLSVNGENIITVCEPTCTGVGQLKIQRITSAN